MMDVCEQVTIFGGDGGVDKSDGVDGFFGQAFDPQTVGRSCGRDIVEGNVLPNRRESCDRMGRIRKGIGGVFVIASDVDGVINVGHTNVGIGNMLRQASIGAVGFES